MQGNEKPGMNILLVDDQLLFLESLKIVLENLTSDMRVIGLAGNGREAVEKAEELKPEMVLMDVRMPVLNGVDAAKIIKEKHPSIHIIMLTAFGDDEHVKKSLKYGAEGYLLKNILPEMLISSIRVVQTGAVLISPDIAGNLIDSAYRNHQNTAKDPKKKIPDWYRELSRKEKTILTLMIQGKTNKEIAYTMHVGSQTIRNYISMIYSKIQAANRSEAVRKASSLGSFLYS